MSRRSRRRGHSGSGGWLGKALIGMIVLGVVAAAVFFAVVRGYLHSDSFRRFLSTKASKVARVDGEFTPFRWDGLAVDSSAFNASGEGLVRELRLEGLHTEVGISGLGRGVWEIKGSRVQRVEVSLDARKSSGRSLVKVKPAAEVSTPHVEKHGWFPTEVELEGLDVGEVVVNALLSQGPLSVEGVRVSVEPAGVKRAFRIEAMDGVVRPPVELVPELRLNRAKIRWQDGEAFLNNLSAAVYHDGRIEMAGEWNSKSGVYAMEGNILGVKCDEVFNETWARRVVGTLESTFSVENPSGSLVSRGRLEIRDGTLTALPVLDALAAYADTRRFRTMSLSDAHTDWRWKQGELFLSNLTLASEGLIRLEGSLHIRGRELDGLFQLGLAPGTLAKIPGAETDVFLPGGHGLVWAPLRISGTLDDPKEDLTDRLVAAAGARMFDVIPETGEKVIKFSRSLIGDTPIKAVDKAVDRGVKIIDQGTDIVEGVGSVIDGFFGSGDHKTPEKKEDP